MTKKKRLPTIRFWRRLSNRNRISILTVVALLYLGIMFFVIWGVKHPRSAEASWFNDNWGYRQAVTVTVSSSSSDISNLDTLITVDTSTLISAGKLQSSCQDLRFTNQKGDILPYYIDSGCNTSTTKIWVRVDLVPKNTTTYLMDMYYGNPGASAGSDPNTFNLYKGLQGYWTFNGSSGNATDSSVNGNTLTNNGTAAYTSAQYRNGTSLTSTSSQYFSVADGSQTGLNVSGPFTMSAWINSTLNSTSGSGLLFNKDSTNGNCSYSFDLNNSGYFLLTICTGGFYHAVLAGTLNIISANTWYFVTLVFDGSTYRIYLNGSEQTSNDFPVSSTATPCGSCTSPFSIGGGESNGINYYFDGKIDDARVYNRALSAGEVAQLYSNPGTIATTATATSQPTTSFATEEKGPGPVAYWKLDEGYGTTTNDSTTNGNSGTISGATWQTEDLCVSGKCLYFPGGTSGKVTAANTVSGVESVSFWVRPASSSAALMTLNSTTSITASGGTISATGFTSPTIYVNGVQSTTLSANRWQQIEITTGTPITASALILGNYKGNYLQGFLDDVKLYNYQRTSSQVLSDYNQFSQTGSGTSASFGQPPNNAYQALSDGLVGYWKMDEATWSGTLNEVIDSSGNNNNGTSEGGATDKAYPTGGKFGNAGYFDGTDDYVSVPDTTSLTINTSTVTLSAWIKISAYPSFGNEAAVVSKHDGSGRFYALRIGSDGTARCYFSGLTPNDSISTSAVGLSTWTHLTCTYDDSNINVFINGELNGTTKQTGSLGISATGNLYIGNDPQVSSFFNGTIDGARVYNRALTPHQAQQLYNFSPGPVGYWKMDEQNGTRYDSSGDGNSLTDANNNIDSTFGKYGKAGVFSGGYLTITNGSQSKLNITGPITYSAWVLSQGTSFIEYNALSKTHYAVTVGSSTNVGYRMAYSNGTIPECGISPDGTSGNENIVQGSTLAANVWAYISCVYDGSTIKIYVNGIQKGSTAYSSGIFNSDGDFRIGGAEYDGGGSNISPWDGFIDDVRIYSYPRTQQQIIEDMNAGHPTGGSPLGTQTGYWKFDTGYGTTAYDSGPNNISGTLTAGGSLPNWKTNGKFGNALFFPGPSQGGYVSMGDPTALQLTGALSLSAWINLGSNTNTEVIMGKWGDSANFGYELFTDSSGKLNLKVSSDGSATTTVTGNTALSLNKWYYVTGVYNPGNSLTVYINGIQDGQNTTSIPSSIFDSTAHFWVGAQNATSSNWFDGMIDEVKVYAGVLTPSQILVDYNHGSSETLGTFSDMSNLTGGSVASSSASAIYCIPGDTSTCSSPIGEWSFDEKQGTTVNDTSGNGYTGTFAGSGTSHWKEGKIGSAGNFNGSDDKVTTPNFSLPSSFTVEAWIYPGAIQTSTDYIIAEEGSNPNDELDLRILSNPSNEYVEGFAAGTTAISDTIDMAQSANQNKWYFYVYTYTSGQQYLYRNGQEVASGTGTGDPSITTTLGIGWDTEFGFGSFLGRIDNVRIYNYVRTPAQVAWDYNRGGPVGWWDMDECQGTVLHDASGNGNNGTLSLGSGGTTTVGTCSTSSSAWGGASGSNAGKINYDLNFDGTDDYVDAGDPSILNFGTNQQFSIALWMKEALSGPYTSGQVLIDKRGTAGYKLYALTNCPSPCDQGDWLIDQGASNVDVLIKTNVLDGKWHFIVAGRDSEKSFVYVDGKLDNTTSNSTLSDLTDAATFKIGSTSNTMNGQIDEVKVFNYALTAAQVKTLYNNGAVNFGPVTGAP